MLVLDLTPPAVPGSSPMQRLNSDPLMAIMLSPSAVTVLVPLTRSRENETILGYGTGTGPPGLGVLQTSGSVFIARPGVPLWTSARLGPLTFTVTDIGLVLPGMVRALFAAAAGRRD